MKETLGGRGRGRVMLCLGREMWRIERRKMRERERERERGGSLREKERDCFR